MNRTAPLKRGTVLLAAATLLTLPSSLQARVAVRQLPHGGPFDRVTLELDGPQLDEGKGENPFANYRLDVTFRNGSTSIKVPGFFAGCADAATRKCTNGRLWRAHFLPGLAGSWSYKVAFSHGPDVVGTDAPGDPVEEIDGKAGTFFVDAKVRDEIRRRGILRYTGQSYYIWSGTGQPFFKFGADSPENTLAYDQFDQTPDYNGLRKSWEAHRSDAPKGDLQRFTWGHGKGTELLGMFQYLKDAGANSVSMLLYNVGGDDRNVVPQRLKVPPSEYARMDPKDQWRAGVFHDRFNLTKLAQWDRALSFANEIGLHLHFKLGENENDEFMDDGKLGRERRIFLREMIARFGHYQALTWNLGEENVQAFDQVAAISRYVAELDPYQHPLVLHTFPNSKERLRPLLGPGSALNGASLQGLSITFVEQREEIAKWATLARESGRRWVIGYDEEGGPLAGAPVDVAYPASRLPSKLTEQEPTREAFRRGSIWNAFTAGASGLEVYYGYGSGCTDLNCQDHRTRSNVWKDGTRALEFFENYVGTEALEMAPDDDLTLTRSDFVFARPGRTYVIFLSTRDSANPNAEFDPITKGFIKGRTLQTFGFPGRYSVRWFDAVNGGPLQQGTVDTIEGDRASEVGDPPSGGSGEWAVLIRRLP